MVLLWQKLLKTNKKGTIEKFLNSRLVLDHICQTARTVGHTESDFPFLPYSCSRALHALSVCVQIRLYDYFGSAKCLA